MSHIVISLIAPNWLGHVERNHERIKRHPGVFRLALTDTVHRMYEIDRAALAKQVARDRASGMGGGDGPL